MVMLLVLKSLKLWTVIWDLLVFYIIKKTIIIASQAKHEVIMPDISDPDSYHVCFTINFWAKSDFSFCGFS